MPDLPPEMVEAAARATHEHDRMESLGEPDFDGLEEADRDSYRDFVRLILAAALSVCEVREEWGVIWHADDRDDASCMSERRFGWRHKAERRGAEMIGKYGIVRYTLERCYHRQYSDWSTWITPWERVTTPTTVEATQHD